MRIKEEFKRREKRKKKEEESRWTRKKKETASLRGIERAIISTRKLLISKSLVGFGTPPT